MFKSEEKLKENIIYLDETNINYGTIVINNQDIIIGNMGTSQQLMKNITDPIIYLVHVISEEYGIGAASDYHIEINERCEKLTHIFNKIINIQESYILNKHKFDDNVIKNIIIDLISIVEEFKKFFSRIYKNKKNKNKEALYENPIICNYLKKFDIELTSLNKELLDQVTLEKNNLNGYDSFSQLELKWKIRNYWVEYFIKNSLKESKKKDNAFKKLLKENGDYEPMRLLKNNDSKLVEDLKKNKKIVQQDQIRLNQDESKDDDNQVNNSEGRRNNTSIWFMCLFGMITWLGYNNI
jgi:hypothetical protein